MLLAALLGCLTSCHFVLDSTQSVSSITLSVVIVLCLWPPVWSALIYFHPYNSTPLVALHMNRTGGCCNQGWLYCMFLFPSFSLAPCNAGVSKTLSGYTELGHREYDMKWYGSFWLKTFPEIVTFQLLNEAFNGVPGPPSVLECTAQECPDLMKKGKSCSYVWLKVVLNVHWLVFPKSCFAKGEVNVFHNS